MYVIMMTMFTCFNLKKQNTKAQVQLFGLDSNQFNTTYWQQTTWDGYPERQVKEPSHLATAITLLKNLKVKELS